MPMDWGNWCGPQRGPVSLQLKFPGWTFITASVSPGGDPTTVPPCNDRKQESRLGVDQVRKHDDQGFH